MSITLPPSGSPPADPNHLFNSHDTFTDEQGFNQRLQDCLSKNGGGGNAAQDAIDDAYKKGIISKPEAQADTDALPEIANKDGFGKESGEVYNHTKEVGLDGSQCRSGETVPEMGFDKFLNALNPLNIFGAVTGSSQV